MVQGGWLYIDQISFTWDLIKSGFSYVTDVRVSFSARPKMHFDKVRRLRLAELWRGMFLPPEGIGS